MEKQMISNIFSSCTHLTPQRVTRCAVGIGNQVYLIECDTANYIFRCSTDDHAYADTIYWLTQLSALSIPVPEVLYHGTYEEHEYLILSYLEGRDIGLVYRELSKQEKKTIAKQVIEIQRRAALLPLEPVDAAWSWYDFLNDLLNRAELRIKQDGYFDPTRVTQVRDQCSILDDYFSTIQPIAYLDDISTKNLLVHNGTLSGIIDVDWIGVGDSLTFIALTYVALANMDCETDYVDYLLEEKGCSDIEKKAFLFYCLVYCVDFMGERGMQFGDKTIAVNDEIIARLYRIYDDLWEKWCREK